MRSRQHSTTQCTAASLGSEVQNLHEHGLTGPVTARVLQLMSLPKKEVVCVVAYRQDKK